MSLCLFDIEKTVGLGKTKAAAIHFDGKQWNNAIYAGKIALHTTATAALWCNSGKLSEGLLDWSCVAGSQIVSVITLRATTVYQTARQESLGLRAEEEDMHHEASYADATSVARLRRPQLQLWKPCL